MKCLTIKKAELFVLIAVVFAIVISIVSPLRADRRKLKKKLMTQKSMIKNGDENYEKLGLSKYILKGIDMRKYDPLEPNTNSGTSGLDYLFSLKEGENWEINYETIDVPEGIDVTKKGRTVDTRKTSSTVKKMEDFKRDMSLELNISTSCPYAFTMSASFSKVSSKVSNSIVKINTESKLNQKYEVNLREEKLDLTQSFKDNLEALPNFLDSRESEEKRKTVRNAFKEFFAKFGTHFILSYVAGFKSSTVKQYIYDKVDTSDSLNVKAEAKGTVGVVSGGLKGSYKSDGKTSNESEKGEETHYTMGSEKDTEVNEMKPIIYEHMVSILLIFDNEHKNKYKAFFDNDEDKFRNYRKKFEGLTENEICLFEATPDKCFPKSVNLQAVTDIRVVFYDNEPDQNNICDLHFTDATRLRGRGGGEEPQTKHLKPGQDKVNIVNQSWGKIN